MGTNASPEVVLPHVSNCRKVSSVRSILNERRLLLLALEERQESISQGEIAEVVCVELGLYDIKVDSLGFGKVKPSLDARIKDHTIEISMRLSNANNTCQNVFTAS